MSRRTGEGAPTRMILAKEPVCAAPYQLSQYPRSGPVCAAPYQLSQYPVAARATNANASAPSTVLSPHTMTTTTPCNRSSSALLAAPGVSGAPTAQLATLMSPARAEDEHDAAPARTEACRFDLRVLCQPYGALRGAQPSRARDRAAKPTPLPAPHCVVHLSSPLALLVSTTHAMLRSTTQGQ